MSQLNYSSPIEPFEQENQKLRSARRMLRYFACGYAVVAAIPLLSSLALAVALAINHPSDIQEWMTGLAFCGGLLIAGLLFATAVYAFWYQRLRWAAMLASGVLLVVFPIGTVLGIVALHTLFGDSGRALFDVNSDEGALADGF